jgi:hypothetical protein
MKILSLSVALALSLLSVNSVYGQTLEAEWDPASGSNAGGGVMIPSSPGGADLRGGPDSDASVSDGAITFGGAQTEPVRTAVGRQFVFTDGHAMEINFLVEPGEGEATILSMADLEIRYDYDEGNIQSILYFDSQGEGPGYKIHRHPVAPGDWVKLNVALLGREFTAEVNGMMRRELINNPLQAKPSSIMLGARIVENASARTLKGKIGKVRLTRN